MATAAQPTPRPTHELNCLRESEYGVDSMGEITCPMPSRRLEDRIRDLCARVVSVDEKKLEPLIAELQSALHEHTGRLRKLAADKLSNPSLPSRKGPTL